MNQKETGTAILFLAALAMGVCLFGYGLMPSRPETGMMRPDYLPRTVSVPRPGAEVRTGHPLPPDAPTSPLPAIIRFIEQAEATMNRTLDKEHWFIQLYGAAQRLAGRSVVEDHANPQYTVVELEGGGLGFVSSEQVTASEPARSLWRLNHVLGQREIPLLYIQAPSKVSDGETDRLPLGVTDGGNAAADSLLDWLDYYGVDALDLRKPFRDAGADWSSWFFRTDHHWTPEAGFFAYQLLCDKIETYERTITTRNGEFTVPYLIAPRNRDPARFVQTVYQNYFLGSQGKRVGSTFAGVDDITLWVPDFATWFEYNIPTQGLVRTGEFADSLLFQERVETLDWFSGNPYTLYAGGDYAIAYIKNHLNPSGPKIMLLRDSFACVLTPFLALACSELITVDLRYFHEELLRYIDWQGPDMVFVLYTTGTVRLEQMFDFFQKPGDRVSFPQNKNLTQPPAPVLPTLKQEPALKPEDVPEAWRKPEKH